MMHSRDDRRQMLTFKDEPEPSRTAMRWLIWIALAIPLAVPVGAYTALLARCFMLGWEVAR